MLVIGEAAQDESSNIKAIVGFCRHSATWRERRDKNKIFKKMGEEYHDIKCPELSGHLGFLQV